MVLLPPLWWRDTSCILSKELWRWCHRPTVQELRDKRPSAHAPCLRFSHQNNIQEHILCNDARNTSFWIMEPRTCPHNFSSYCRNRRRDRILECNTRKCSYSFRPPPGAVIKDFFSKERVLLKELVL